MKLAIVDYDAGNIRSIEKALKKLDQSVTITKNPKAWAEADALVLPGVGSFSCVNAIPEKMELISLVNSGKPFLGICLGMQLLFEKSEESPEAGLGLLKGEVQLLKPKDKKLKVPQMGWNTLLFRVSGLGTRNSELGTRNSLLEGITENDYFYFVHSYAAKKSSAAAALTDYGGKFVSVVEKGNIFATQFHPEKSGETGFRILRNFLKAAKA